MTTELAASPVVDWLLRAEEPWVVYNTRRDLLGAPADDVEAQTAYDKMRAHPQVGALLASLDPWPPAAPLSRAYDPKDSLWQLNTLADFGLQRDDPRIAALADRVFAAQAEDGGFLHGGFDHTKSWHTRPYICISHIMTYALARFGYCEDPRLKRAYDHILSWQRLDGGWHPNKATLPGGERENEPSCPFGTVNILRAVAASPGLCDSAAAARAAGFLLDCWERRAEPYRPVGFGIGTTWDKLQFPFVQYQLLKTADTLAQLPSARKDARFHEMLERLELKRGPDGKWTAESVNKPYADFDFGQKKQPSPWITFLALRALGNRQ